MLFKIKKKNDEFLLIIYKKDLSVDLSKILTAPSSDIKEYLLVNHTDTAEEHYHIYLKFNKKITRDELRELFYKSKIFISNVSSDTTILGILYYFTDGFRLSFESNYSINYKK